MSKTNYQKVVQFNRVFGVPVAEQPRHNIFDQDPKLVELRMNLIREEVHELEDAVKEKNMTETFDALSDILYVVYGMGASLGLDLDKGIELVHDSNMSKSCMSEKEAKDTVQWYKEKYSSGEQPYDSPSYRKSDDGNYWIVYNSSTGKILKSINYSPVDFTNILS
mgnify:CR=1 FL=1